MQFKPPRKHIGPSHFATILEYNDFQTPEELRKELEEGSLREIRPSQTFGIEKEAAARKYYEKVRGCKVTSSSWVRHGPHILGKGDGFVGAEGGLEIKCHWSRQHPLANIPIYYLVQIIGYLWLYKREWWDLMSCCFDETGQIREYSIHRVYWKDWKDAWTVTWLPRISEFLASVNWVE